MGNNLAKRSFLGKIIDLLTGNMPAEANEIEESASALGNTRKSPFDISPSARKGHASPKSRECNIDRYRYPSDFNSSNY